MKQVFINLPVADPDASMAFYKSIGFTLNPLFTFDDQKCMVWCDQVYVMLQSKDLFHKGNTKTLADSRQYAIASFTLPVDNLHTVNQLVEAALQAGGKEAGPMIDEGFMQVRTLEDPDGHSWGILSLDMEKFRAATGK